MQITFYLISNHQAYFFQMSDYKSLLPSDKIKDYENEYYIYHSVQSHISTIDERGKATERLNMGMPDMLYGKNELSIKSKTKDFELNVFYLLIKNASVNLIILQFNPYDALDKCHEYFEKYPEVKVIEAESWKITKQNFKELPHNYDWTYSTTYLGTFKGSCKYEIIENSGKLPMDKLTDTTDKVEFFDSLYLYEDELCDNGEVTLNIKIVYFYYIYC